MGGRPGCYFVRGARSRTRSQRPNNPTRSPRRGHELWLRARPQTPACTRGQVRLTVSLPVANYYGGSPVPFKVRLANVSSQPCSVTALEPPSGLATELVFVRLFDSFGRRVLIPGGPPGLRVRMLPKSLAAHQVFSYICSWSGRVWTGSAGPRPGRLGGVPAPAGRYTAVAILANPAVQTGPLHFVLKAR